MVESQDDRVVVRVESDGTHTIVIPAEPEEDITIEVAIMRKLDAMADVLNGIQASVDVLRSRLNGIELAQSYMKSELKDASRKL